MTDEQHGGQVFRQAWIDGVKKYYPGEPKAGYVAPWEDTPDWERAAAVAVYDQVSQFIQISSGATSRLSREQKGRFVALCWIAQIHKHLPDAKPSYTADWPDMPEWQRETDSDIFDAVAQATAV